ncbi:unnamed protein product [Peronospora farinosa]|uniref:Uncharacterized protein n=1 Tax=Peronospora farinosa TaxID=134698 RepID=A0AAV0UV52_9STRA|nr:unnamed protein product [Peronospora farinosa]
MAMDAAMLVSDKQRAGLSISKLGGRAREWALTGDVSVNAAFYTWEMLKKQLTCQDPLAEEVRVTVFMEGLRTGVARTEVFRVQPSTFKEEVSIAFNAEFNFKSSRYGLPWYRLNASSRAEPMDLSQAEEAELQAAEQQGGKDKQGLAPGGSVNASMEQDYKPGLLVVSATVKGFEKPWSILIDSGASGNYVRRRSLEGSQLYAEALEAQEGDSITVRLATGVRVTVPKVPLNLGVKLLDFNSVERYLVLDLDSRYDLILGMAWLERHEPWIDWRSKTLGATRNVPSKLWRVMNPPSLRNKSAIGASY